MKAVSFRRVTTPRTPHTNFFSSEQSTSFVSFVTEFFLKDGWPTHAFYLLERASFQALI